MGEGGHPGQCRIFISILGFCSTETRSIYLQRCDNQKCLKALPNASRGQKSLCLLATDFMKAEHPRSSRGCPFSSWPTTSGLRKLTNSIRSSARAYAVTVLVKVSEN